MKKILLIAGFVAVLAGANGAWAYELQPLDNTPVEEDFVLGPGRTDLVLEPGEKSIQQIAITNRLGRSQDFNLEIEDFSGSDNPDQTVRLFGDIKGPYSLKDYVKPEITKFSLKHGERIIIPIEIDIPEDSEAGGLYASVIVSSASDESNPVRGSQHFLGIQDLVVGDGKKLPAGDLDSPPCLVCAHRVPDPDGGGHCLGIVHRAALHHGSRSLGLNAHQPRKFIYTADLPVEFEPGTIGTDISCVAHGQHHPVRDGSKLVADLPGSAPLAEEPVRIHRIHDSQATLFP